MWGKPVTTDDKLVCSLTKPPTIFIEPVPRQKIQYLMDEYSHQEWLAYLVGRISEKENIFVEDISVPPHAHAYGAEAEAEPFHIPDNCVGIIHSHHSMGAFHSGTDSNYVDKNFPVSIVVARGNGGLTYDAVSFAKTPCGRATTGKPEVKYVQFKPLFDKDKFLAEAKENIDKAKITARTRYPVSMLGCGNYPYVPVRHRISDPTLGNFVVDQNGRVIPQHELEDILANSYEGD